MKKKLLVLALAFAVIFTFTLTGCGKDAEEVSDYGEGYTFVQGFDADFPPYSHIDDNGEVSGFDVELCQALCEELGWNYEPHSLNWDAKDAELNSGACDCIWSGFTVEGREDDYVFSIPYSENSQMILVNKDSGIKTLDDLAGKKVGVQTATSAFDMLNEGAAQELAKTFGELVVEETYTICYEDLKAGAIDAIAIDITTGDYLTRNDNGQYVYLSENIGTETYAVGFRLGDEALAEKVNEGLKALAANGKFDEIAKKYPDIAPFLSISAE